MLQYSSTQNVSCYSTVQHTLYHVTVQFNTNCIIYLYLLFLSNTVQNSSTHTVSCYSTVQHTIYHFFYLLFLPNNVHFSSTHTGSCYGTLQHTPYHVTVQFNTHCIMLQYNLTQTVSSICMYCSFSNIVQYSSTQIVSCYNTVQHTLYHLFYVLFLFQHCTKQFNTNCIMLQYSSTHTVSSLCMNCSFFNTVEYSSTHTVSCYSTVHFKLSHIKVQSIANCIMLQYISTHTVSSLCKYCYFPNTVQYSSTHTLSCYITFQHTL